MGGSRPADDYGMTPAMDLNERIAPGPAEARVLVVDESSELAQSLRAIVPSEERASFDDLAHEDDRRAALTSRGMLRLGLSVLSGEPASHLRINRDALGRPMIEGDVDLNISRRRGCSALVLARGGGCGIDIERLETGDRRLEILRALSLQGVIRDDQYDSEKPFIHWCSLEAVLKADGRGFSEGSPKARLEGDIRSDGSSIWTCGGDSWTVRAIQTPSGFVGVVALSGAIAACSQLLVGADDREESMRILCASGIPGQP